MGSDTFVIGKGMRISITLGTLICALALIWSLAGWMGDIRFDLRSMREKVNEGAIVQKEISRTLISRFEAQTELKARVIILEREINNIKRGRTP